MACACGQAHHRERGDNGLWIYSIPLRGGDPLLLVKDWSLQRFTTLFAFDSQGKYALYASYTGRDSYTGLDADPTGCFTVVNSGLPSNSGTRLVLLPD